MKVIKILGNPVLAMSLFLLIIIEGKRFGGVYLLYILISLPHGAPYAIIGILGLMSLLIGYNITNRKENLIKPMLYLIGTVLLILSLVVFFTKDPKGNNDATFEQAVPLISLLLFSISVICLLLQTIIKLTRINNDKVNNIKATS